MLEEKFSGEPEARHLLDLPHKDIVYVGLTVVTVALEIILLMSGISVAKLAFPRFSFTGYL